MTRRDRLRGRRFSVGTQVQAEIRRSCRDELKLIYEATAFSRETWERLAKLGQTEVLEASKINPAMRDLFRVQAQGMRFEGAVGATSMLAFFRGPGRLRARHLLQRALREAFGEG